VIKRSESELNDGTFLFMNWFQKWKARKRFITNMTPQEVALVVLEADELRMEIGGNDVHQVELNIISDKLRRYLGEQSKVYISFSQIDISPLDGRKLLKLQDAVRLIQAARQTIEANGLYEDFQMQLMKINIKQAKNKVMLTSLGAIGGALLSNLKDIGKFLLSLLHLLHK
jgi:hypothetical protein